MHTVLSSLSNHYRRSNCWLDCLVRCSGAFQFLSSIEIVQIFLNLNVIFIQYIVCTWKCAPQSTTIFFSMDLFLVGFATEKGTGEIFLQNCYMTFICLSSVIFIYFCQCCAYSTRSQNKRWKLMFIFNHYEENGLFLFLEKKCDDRWSTNFWL